MNKLLNLSESPAVSYFDDGFWNLFVKGTTSQIPFDLLLEHFLSFLLNGFLEVLGKPSQKIMSA